MGATSMPRMNVIISLICRNVLNKGIPTESEGVPEYAMQQKRHNNGMARASMSMENGTETHSATAIIIGDYNPQCSIKEVESATAMFNLWGNLLAGVIAAIVTPFWGKLSDRFGRVKPLAAATTVMLLSEALMVLVAKFPDALPLNWVYLTFVLEGMRSVKLYAEPVDLNTESDAVGRSYSSWRWHHRTPQTVPSPRTEMLLLAGSMEACSSVWLLGRPCSLTRSVLKRRTILTCSGQPSVAS
jgi:hypothetical protein